MDIMIARSSEEEKAANLPIAAALVEGRGTVPYPMQQQSSGNRPPVLYDDYDCSTFGALFWSKNGSCYAGGAEAWQFFRIPRYDRADIA